MCYGTNTYQNAQSSSNINRTVTSSRTFSRRPRRKGKENGQCKRRKRERGSSDAEGSAPACPLRRDLDPLHLALGIEHAPLWSWESSPWAPCPFLPEGRGRAGDHITYSLSQSWRQVVRPWRPITLLQVLSAHREVSCQEGGRVGAPGRVQRDLSREKGQGRERTLLIGATGDCRRAMSAFEKLTTLTGALVAE